MFLTSVFELSSCFFFFFNDTATTEIYTLSLHDALPISAEPYYLNAEALAPADVRWPRSEEHTSELQSHHDLVCRLLLEKKKKQTHKKNKKKKTKSTLHNTTHNKKQ